MGSVKKLPWFVLLAVGLAYLFSRLAFSPLPWPDAAAVLMTGEKLASFPPLWRPEYADLGPLFPLLSGIAGALGMNHIFGASLAIRILGLLPLLIAAGSLWSWVRRRTRDAGVKPSWATTLAAAPALGLLLDPTARWGGLIARPETWVGMFWILLLRELDSLEQAESVSRAESGALLRGTGDSTTAAKRDLSPRYWLIAILFSLALGFDLDAWCLLPALFVGLARIPNWKQAGWRTLAASAPWILHYAVHRAPQGAANTLGYAPGTLSTFQGLIDGLFLELPGVVAIPPVLVSAKILFWLLVLGLITLLAKEFVQITREMGKTRHMERRGGSQVLALSAAVGFLGVFCLWNFREDAWLGMLSHFMAWGWVATLMIRLGVKVGQAQGARAPIRSLAALTVLAALAATGFLVSAVRTATATPAAYSWGNYLEWNDCIERSIASTGHAHPIRAWQAQLPDALAEASFRFKELEVEHGPKPGPTSDFLMINRIISENLYEKYEGPERDEDRKSLQALNLELGEHSAFNWKACQYGPFWMDVGIRK